VPPKANRTSIVQLDFLTFLKAGDGPEALVADKQRNQYGLDNTTEPMSLDLSCGTL
jgi:hypothetical protein